MAALQFEQTGPASRSEGASYGACLCQCVQYQVAKFGKLRMRLRDIGASECLPDRELISIESEAEIESLARQARFAPYFSLFGSGCGAISCLSAAVTSTCFAKVLESALQRGRHSSIPRRVDAGAKKHRQMTISESVRAGIIPPLRMRLRPEERMSRSLHRRTFLGLCAVFGALVAPMTAQSSNQTERAVPPPAGQAPKPIVLPAGYVIGPEDVLSVVVWREKDMSLDVVVRPDGKISLPLLKDVQAAGYTPEQLAAIIDKSAKAFVADSDATVIVKEIRSRKVYVIGEVARPGLVPLTSEMTVLQLIAVVGGLLEYADKSNVLILRNENGREHRLRFNYKDVVAGRNLQQNVRLQPGDTVLVR